MTVQLNEIPSQLGQQDRQLPQSSQKLELLKRRPGWGNGEKGGKKVCHGNDGTKHCPGLVLGKAGPHRSLKQTRKLHQTSP